MILSFLFYAFLAFVLYKLIFNFIVPVYRTTKKIKKGFREMNETLRNQNNGFSQQQSPPEQKTEAGKKGDYIEFEEVK
ncbi:MAG: hypothetical protein V4676_00230 [Bacteroidota bacterium]